MLARDVDTEIPSIHYAAVLCRTSAYYDSPVISSNKRLCLHGRPIQVGYINFVIFLTNTWLYVAKDTRWAIVTMKQ